MLLHRLMDPLLHLNGLLPAHLNGLLLVHLNGLLLVHLNGLNLVHQLNQEPLNKLSNPNQATTPLLTPQLIRNNPRLLTQSNHNNLILSNRSHPTLNNHNLCTQSQPNHIIPTQSSNHPMFNGISGPLTLGNSNLHHPVHGSKLINQLPHGANLLAMDHFQHIQLQNLVTARVQVTRLQDTIWQTMVISPAIQPNLAMNIILATLPPPAYPQSESTYGSAGPGLYQPHPVTQPPTYQTYPSQPPAGPAQYPTAPEEPAAV